MNRKLNILVLSDIIPVDEPGGSGRVAWELAKVLSSRGHKVIIITKGIAKSDAVCGIKKSGEMEATTNIQIHRYYSNPFKFKKIWEKVVRENIPDILHGHSPYTTYLAVWLNNKKIPLVYTFYSPWHEEYEIRSKDLKRGYIKKMFGSVIRKMIEHKVLKCAKRIVTTSRFMYDKIKKYYKLTADIIPLGVDIKKFFPVTDVYSIRQKFNIPKEKFVILTIRNLVSRMGLENLVQSMVEISKKVPEVYLIIGGTGYLKTKLEQQIKDFNLQNFVRLEGYISDDVLPMYYQSADLFVLPTRLLEGFGLVTLESMACGTPVLATPVGANIELLNRFDNSFLFKGIGPSDISEGIINFISKYLTQKDIIRKRCREFVEENYSWDKYAEEIEKIFYEVI